MTLDQPLDWQGVAMWLEMLVASRGENLLRVKGILNLKGYDCPVVIHAVRHLMHPPAKLAAWPNGDPRTSRLVFITRDLPRAVIEDGLRAFQAASHAAGSDRLSDRSPIQRALQAWLMHRQPFPCIACARRSLRVRPVPPLAGSAAP